MIKDAELNKYTKTLRRLLWLAYREGYNQGDRETADESQAKATFEAWVVTHSDARAEAARRFLDAAAEEGYV